MTIHAIIQQYIVALCGKRLFNKNNSTLPLGTQQAGS